MYHDPKKTLQLLKKALHAGGLEYEYEWDYMDEKAFSQLHHHLCELTKFINWYEREKIE